MITSKVKRKGSGGGGGWDDRRTLTVGSFAGLKTTERP
jgi:hypothetical protein